MKRPLVRLILDMAIVAGVFEVYHFLKFDRFLLKEDYLNLFGILIFSWVIFSAYYKRYTTSFYTPFSQTVRSLFWTTVATLFAVTLILGLFDITIISRLFVLAVIVTPFLVEMLLYFVHQMFRRQNPVQDDTADEANLNAVGNQSYSWIFMGAVWILVIYFGLIYLKTGAIVLYPSSEIVLLTLFAAWGVSTAMTRKYAPNRSSNIYYQTAPFIKSGMLMIVFVGMAFFFLRLEDLSRMLLFGTAALHSVFETLNFALFFLAKRDRDHKTVIVSQLDANKAPEQKLLPIPAEDLSLNGHTEDMMNVAEVLARISIPYKDDLLNFLSRSVHILKAKKEQISILLTSTTE
ncbi:MAG: hypothetical protein HGB19_03255, partial [Chlorobiales bacterium]|nr:hypothetical protein [Chlorobiales bacterium]